MHMYNIAVGKARFPRCASLHCNYNTYIASARQLRFIQAIRYSYTRFDFPWSQCLCVRQDRECCSTDEPIEIPFARRLAWAPETIVLDGVHGHIGAIWRIRLIDTCGGGDAGCR